MKYEFIDEALGLLPPSLDTIRARVLMIAIGLQESRFEFRRQMNEGPAMGFWQFERMGGVKGVLEHPASKRLAHMACAVREVEPTPLAAWKALETDDVLAAIFARLLLRTDPNPLPEVSMVDEAWDYYLRNWRPGKPHRKTWDSLYARAIKEVL